MPGWQKVDGSLTASGTIGEVSTHSFLGHDGFYGVSLLRPNWIVLQIAEQLLEAKTDAFDWSAVQELRAVFWTKAAALWLKVSQNPVVTNSKWTGSYQAQVERLPSLTGKAWEYAVATLE